MSGLGVAIMAGGPGLRLAAINHGKPKALAAFDGATLLDYQLAQIRPLNPDCIVVLAHHGAEAVQQHLSARKAWDVDVLVESHPMGTAGALHSLPDHPERWLVRYVDHFSDVDCAALAATKRAPCTAVITEVNIPIDEGVVTLEEGRLVNWQERPIHRVQVTTGLYVFQRSSLATVLNGQTMDMPDLVRALMPEVVAWPHAGTWFDAGTPDRLRSAERWYQAQRSNHSSVAGFGN